MHFEPPDCMTISHAYAEYRGETVKHSIYRILLLNTLRYRKSNTNWRMERKKERERERERGREGDIYIYIERERERLAGA